MSIKAIITDIEGTTTPLSFVKEVLFPYAYEHLSDYVHEHQHESNILQLLSETRIIAEKPDLSIDDMIALFLEWIREDKKITPLKTLQGWIWEDGYKKGELQGDVYPDAALQLKAWHQSGIKLAIFSSGSVLAQKLLFSHTAQGDLTPLFFAFFDTTTGAKNTETAYQKIAEQLGFLPSDILFLSDAQAELDAASSIGMKTIGLIRKGDTHTIQNHKTVTEFNEIIL